jgi:hypothetical protein
MSIGNYYVSGYSSEFFTTNLFDGSLIHQGVIEEIVILQQFLEIPHTNYMAVISKEQILMIVPVLTPIPNYVEQRRVNLAFENNA